MAGGNFDVHFDGTDYREVAELSDTLNMTRGNLEGERLRQELIANVSHDLRDTAHDDHCLRRGHA